MKRKFGVAIQAMNDTENTLIIISLTKAIC